jgi:hypothetical protein
MRDQPATNVKEAKSSAHHSAVVPSIGSLMDIRGDLIYLKLSFRGHLIFIWIEA